MSWPIGYGLPNVAYRGDISGTIYANSHPVTDQGGWMDLPAPRLSSTHGTAQEISVRVRVSVDAHGVPFLYAEEVEIGGRRFAGLHSLVASEGEAWLNYLVAAIHVKMARCIALASESPTASRTRANAPPGIDVGDPEMALRATPSAGNRGVPPGPEPRTASGTRTRTAPITAQQAAQPLAADPAKRR